MQLILEFVVYISNAIYGSDRTDRPDDFDVSYVLLWTYWIAYWLRYHKQMCQKKGYDIWHNALLVIENRLW